MPTGFGTVALTNLSPRLKSVPSFTGTSSLQVAKKATTLNYAHPATKVDSDVIPPLHRSVTFVSITKSLGRPPRNAAHLAPPLRETEGKPAATNTFARRWHEVPTGPGAVFSSFSLVNIFTKL